MSGRAQDSEREEAARIATLLAARAYLHELLHKCLGGEPNAELIAALTSQNTLDAVALYAEDDESMAGLAALLGQAADLDAASVLDRAHDEYTRIFEGPGALPAPPYRAPYTGSHDAALFQEATLEVRRLYRTQGLRVRREQAVPDDHVALLLDYAARGAARLQELFASGDECFAEAARPQHQAISGYLADWLPEYAQLVRNSRVGQSAFLYPQLLEAAAAFSKVDCVFLSEAAWWFEQQEGKAEHLAAGSAASDAETELPVRLSTARAELALLRLRGLEDNELTVLDRLEG